MPQRSVSSAVLLTVAVVIGAGFLALGLAAVAVTGFSPVQPLRPRTTVLGLPHTPLLGVGEIVFGVATCSVFTIAAVAPRLARLLIMFLSGTSLAAGVVILAWWRSPQLDHWIAARPALGWVYAAVGALGLIVAFSTNRPAPAASPAATERVLATVVFTDIVASTQKAATLGDRRWRRVLDRHDAVTRDVLERFRGSEVRRTGDGFLATFDSPARAVHCATAAMASLRPMGVQLRVGVHTGEVELRDDGIDGIAVHIGARVCDRAEPDEILVSQTVKDATAGSDLRFVDRGEHELKGVPERWQLYAART
jgi:class 3 adenylate cyclase